uniref:capsular polysaccharide export protein, LipB/KpsS family n=1 Tax=Flavobacterium sp. TaxID=239 RepID=UPI004049B081
MAFSWKQYLKHFYLLREGTRAYRSYNGQPEWIDKFTDKFKQKVKTGSDKKVLIATGGGSYLSGVAIESMLGAALTLRGLEAHILLCDAVLPACFQSDIDWDRNERKFAEQGPSKIFCKSCFKPSAKMYESLGFTVHRISDMVQPEERVIIKKMVYELPYDQIRNYTYEGIPAGEHAYAGTLRFYAKAELSDTYSEQILRRYLEASIISTIAIKRLCKKVNFSRAVLHHGIYVPQGVFAESLMQLKIPIVTWHVAYRKETFMFSHSGTYHRTLMTESVSNWENLPWSDKLNIDTIEYLNSRWFGTQDWIHFHKNTVFDKEKLYTDFGIDRNKPYLLALTNVMWDAQLHYPNNAFSGMLDWIKHTIQWFIKHPELQLVLRVHPAEVNGTLPSRQLVIEEIEKAFSVLPSNIFVIGPNNPISTYVLAEDCNAAIIYGTKTGVELAAKGIPVIVAGEAWIRNKGISIDVTNPAQYDSILDSLPLPSRMDEQQILRARKYAYHFFFRRMVPLPFVKAISKGCKPYDFQIQNMHELEPGHHKGLDLICNGIIYGEPFIFESENN